MLIINADDFGRDHCATDRAMHCFREGRISSTTAMVFMADSERAAELARNTGIGIGLHINFSERFTAAGVPARLAASQKRIACFLKRNKIALIFFHPFLTRDFRYCFECQHAEFLRLFGPPSHFDGHQHLHLATNVLAAGILPSGAKVRRSFTFARGEKGILNRAYRRWVDNCLARRHPLTDHFFSLAHHMDPDRLGRLVRLSRTANIELMTHPALLPEFRFLTSDDFSTVVGATRLTNYAELKGS